MTREEILRGYRVHMRATSKWLAQRQKFPRPTVNPKQGGDTQYASHIVHGPKTNPSKGGGS